MNYFPLKLEALSQEQANWFLANGAPASILESNAIVTCRGIHAKDGRFDPDPEGEKSFAFMEDSDLVFWNPKSGQLSTAEGRSFALGEHNLYYFAAGLEGYLKVYADPLRWLQNDRRGIVIVEWKMTFDKLHFVHAVAVDEEIYGLFRIHMKPPRMPKVAVLPKTEWRAA
jgi:hypothetical protein